MAQVNSSLLSNASVALLTALLLGSTYAVAQTADGISRRILPPPDQPLTGRIGKDARRVEAELACAA